MVQDRDLLTLMKNDPQTARAPAVMTRMSANPRVSLINRSRSILFKCGRVSLLCAFLTLVAAFTRKLEKCAETRTAKRNYEY